MLLAEFGGFAFFLFLRARIWKKKHHLSENFAGEFLVEAFVGA